MACSSANFLYPCTGLALCSPGCPLRDLCTSTGRVGPEFTAACQIFNINLSLITISRAADLGGDSPPTFLLTQLTVKRAQMAVRAVQEHVVGADDIALVRQAKVALEIVNIDFFNRYANLQRLP